MANVSGVYFITLREAEGADPINSKYHIRNGTVPILYITLRNPTITEEEK